MSRLKTSTITIEEVDARYFGFEKSEKATIIVEQTPSETHYLSIDVPAYNSIETRAYKNGKIYRTIINTKTNTIEHIID